MDAQPSFRIFYLDANAHYLFLFFFFFLFAAASALFILRLRNADALTPRLASAFAGAVMLLLFLDVGRDEASYFDAYALFIAGVALLFVRVWAATGRHHPVRVVTTLVAVIALLSAKLAVAAVFLFFPLERSKEDGRVNLDDVSMILAAGIVLNMLAHIM